MCKKIGTKGRKPRKNPRQPWFNEDCEKNRKIYLEAKNSIWKAKSTEEKDQCCENMKQKGKEYKLFISNTQKTYSRELNQKLRELKMHHPKEYWKILKAAEGVQLKEPKVSMEDCENHFKTLSSEKSESNIPEFDPQKIDLSSNEELNVDFTLEEVMESIHELKNNKAEGVDYIKNEYLKNCPPDVVKLMVGLFNLILKFGFVPAEWCLGLIVPVFKKKGSPQDVNNYRGITLLSCIGKLFTSCINTRLTKYLDRKGIIGEEQAGFREGYSALIIFLC